MPNICVSESIEKDDRETLADAFNLAIMSARTDFEAEQIQASTGITPDTLGATLKDKLDASHVDIADLSGMRDQRSDLSLGKV